MKDKPNIFERVVSWMAAPFRRVDGMPLPSDGRSSVETPQGQLLTSAFGSVIPPFDIQMLPKLKQLWITNPDFSQFVSNAESLGNTGHAITVDAATENAASAALARVNESASRLYQNGAGVDGLINALLDQLAWSGALSAEDVVDFAGRRVEKTVLVPVETIRFRYLEGHYVPHQQPGVLLALSRHPMGLIPLNEHTYTYFAIQQIENLPYAKPPASAAVELLMGPQKHAIDNISSVISKLGLIGLVIAKLTKPRPKSGESETEYKARAEGWQQSVLKQLDGRFNKGLLVAFDDIKWEHANVAADARGAEGVMQILEELVFSGMSSMAAFHGRNYTTTETFADVIYSILTAQTVNRQRLVKRRIEQTYRLDLLLAGLPHNSISVNFNRVEARNDLQKAQAEEVRQRMILEKAAKGIISPDDAAQELGYEAAFDPALLSSQPTVAHTLSARRLSGLNRDGVSATFRFDRQAQRYRFLSSRIEIASEPAGAGEIADFGLRISEFKKKQPKAA